MSEVVTTKTTAKTPEKKPEKKKHYWWRYLLTFLGGFIFGIGVIAGGVAITLTVIKAGDVVKMTGNNPDDILGIQYQNQSILSIITGLKNTPMETLGDLNEISPIIKKSFDESVNPVLETNLHYSFNWDELKIKPFKKSTSGRPATEVDPVETLGDYIPRALKSGITLASFLDPNKTATGIERVFLYPKDSLGNYLVNQPYTINDYLATGFIDSLKNNIKIGDVVTNIASNPFLNQLADWGINDFTDENIRTNIKLGPLFANMTEEQKNQNPIVKAIGDWSIGTLANMENLLSLRLEQVVDLRSATGLLSSLKEKTLSEIKQGNFINDIALGSIFPSATGIMGVLVSKNLKVGDLQDNTKILALTIEEIFPSLSSDSILYKFRTKSLSEISSMDVASLKLTDIFTLSDITGNLVLNALYQKNNNITFGQLLNSETIQSIEIADLYPSSTNNVVAALESMSPTTTIGNLETNINKLTLSQVVGTVDPTTTLGKVVAAVGSTPISGLATAFNSLKVSDVIDIDTSNPNTPQILITMKNNNVTLNGISTFMNGLTAKDVIKIGDSTDPLYAIKDVSVTDSASLITALKSNLALKDVCEIDLSDPNTPTVLVSLANTKLKDIESTLTTLTLEQVIPITNTSPQILKSLRNTVVFGTTDNLQTRLVNLKFNDYFTESDCSSGVLNALWNSTSPTKGDFLLSNIASKVDSLKLVDVLDEKIYETDGVTIKSLWWYLLTEEGETFTSSEFRKTLKNGANYTINQMDKLITNMEYHIHKESIYNLIDAGLITVSDTSKLATLVRNPNVSDPTDPNYMVALGSLSISDAINTLLALVH